MNMVPLSRDVQAAIRRLIDRVRAGETVGVDQALMETALEERHGDKDALALDMIDDFLKPRRQKAKSGIRDGRTKNQGQLVLLDDDEFGSLPAHAWVEIDGAEHFVPIANADFCAAGSDLHGTARRKRAESRRADEWAATWDAIRDKYLSCGFAAPKPGEITMGDAYQKAFGVPLGALPAGDDDA